MVEVCFEYQRERGTIRRLDDGSFIVEVENQKELQEEIVKFLKEFRIKRLVEFNHPGIPGKMRRFEGIATDRDFLSALGALEKQLDIWIEKPE